MRQLGNALITWLETHWVAPAYAGGLLLGLTIAFFGAAVNSMSGWLYAISGVMLAIALVSVWSPPRSFKGIQITRQPIRPTSVGEALTVELVLANPTSRPKILLQARDGVPPSFGMVPETAIASISPDDQHAWIYTCYPTRRGIYRWDTLTLRTAAPLGLFWCQRPQVAPAHATIYPEILPLTRCPLIDQTGTSSGLRWQASRQAQTASEGLTRALRPYRWGDPTRLIHWRTSARYGELRVRELEELTADNQVLIGLDPGDRWSPNTFESAIVAAASLYHYSLRHQLAVALWLPHTGILQGQHAVLSALAEVSLGRSRHPHLMPAQSLIWLGHQAPRTWPAGSLWVQWQDPSTPDIVEALVKPALTVTLATPLLEQLQTEV